MTNPTETQLKYKEQGDGTITLLVNQIAGAEYVWQFCEAGTAVWEELDRSDKNIFFISTDPILHKGDKYRCLILVDKKVLYYSKVLTVGIKKYHSQDEYTNKEQNQYQYQHKYQYHYQEKQPSVSDTDGMDGITFEHYCAEVLRKNGFIDIKVTQGSGDYGIDILAKKDSISYAIQCKCYASAVGNKAVQEAYSGKSFYHCMVAAVLTNNYFTDAAIETAKRNAVVLWNRDYLDNMIRYSNHREQEDRRQEQQRQESEKQRQNKQQDASSGNTIPDFFKGCSSWEQVKERYRKLMQMYHPDHESGDEEYAKAINIQYEQQKQKYNQ